MADQICNGILTSQSGVNFTSALHTPNYGSNEPIVTSLAGLSEIRLAKLKKQVATRQSQVTSAKVKSKKYSEKTRFESSNSKMVYQARVDALKLRLFPFTGRTSTENGLTGAYASSIRFSVENRSQSDLTFKMKLQNGFDTVVATAKVSSASGQQIIEIPSSEFQVVKDFEELSEAATIEIELENTEPKAIDIDFFDSIIIKKDLNKPLATKEFQKLFALYARDYGMKRNESDKLVRRLIKQLYDPIVQLKALEIIDHPSYLNYFLKAYDLKLQYLAGSTSPLVRPLSNSALIAFFGSKSIFRHRSIPVETGLFAQEHGDLSHAAQLICLLYGLSARESEVVINFYSKLLRSGGASEMWAIWEAFFDGAGNSSPTEPRFWRDRVNDALEANQPSN